MATETTTFDPTRVDGPHGPEMTAAATRLITDAVRFLNYATASRSGIGGASDVDGILGGLEAAAGGLQQTLRQCADCLRTEQATGQLRLDAGRPYASDPAAAVSVACADLAMTAGLCESLRTALIEVRRITAGMYREEG
jgi:hypothetical protein